MIDNNFNIDLKMMKYVQNSWKNIKLKIKRIRKIIR